MLLKVTWIIAVVSSIILVVILLSSYVKIQEKLSPLCLTLLQLVLCFVFQEEYRVEGISLERITFTDNRPVLDMFLQVDLAILNFSLFKLELTSVSSLVHPRENTRTVSDC